MDGALGSHGLVELFAGCGGMALGLASVGFRHDLLVDWHGDAARTVAHNIHQGVSDVHGWRYECRDVCEMDWSGFRGRISMVAGGPPCQPFSLGGKSAGYLDSRDMWPEAVRAVREMEPAAFLFENVKGMLRPAFRDYLGLVTAWLACPDARRVDGESMEDFHHRIMGMRCRYQVGSFLVDAADYGAGQRRHRVLFAGFRRDLGVCPQRPPATHSRERLLWEQWITGEYWRRHGMGMPPIPDDVATRLVPLRSGPPPQGLAWRTCRDTLEGLGEPSGRMTSAHSSEVANHVLQPGAKSYPGHTGCALDQPAKALKAGVHGVPGGENMLRLDDGGVRYFSVREAARLQGIPDTFRFPSSWSASMRLLGNAVPTPLAQAFGRMMMDGLVPTPSNVSGNAPHLIYD